MAKKKAEEGKGAGKAGKSKPDSSKKPQKQREHDAASHKPRPKGDSDVVQLVRVSGVVVDGSLDMTRALMKIKGIGSRVSNTMLQTLGYDKNAQIGSLSEEQIDELEKQITNLSETLPEWMLNRKKDKETGEYMHLTGSDLDISKREDINLERKIKSYRGVRHSLNLTVRGQRTRSSFRKGSTIGVSRKKGR
ncbi:MAG: 30S ribosomal protein S13 [Candidatus Altiarchaeota archaeon]